MPASQEAVEKLKTLATNKELDYRRREEAIRALGDLGSKEAALALLDVANDKALYRWEREMALAKAREILEGNV